jgi:hypothetical protein
VSDGTAAGTRRISDAVVDNSHSVPVSTAIAGRLFFVRSEGVKR